MVFIIKIKREWKLPVNQYASCLQEKKRALIQILAAGRGNHLREEESNQRRKGADEFPLPSASRVFPVQ